MASTEAASSERAVTPPRGTGWADAPYGVQPGTPPAHGAGRSPVRERAGLDASARTAVRPLAGAPRAPSRAAALLGACRPRQWSKNVLLLAAPGAAGVLFHAAVLGRAALALVAFCVLSSCVYLLNDVHDRTEDALDPRKARRPIAAGELPANVALLSATLLAAAGLGLAAAVGLAFAGMGAGYLALTGSYTLWWRRVAVADIVAVAGGFVLRAIAGGVATGVPVSRWFVIVTSFGALFLVAGKRYAELVEATAPAVRGSTRAALHAYSAAYLRFVMILAAAVAVGAYCLWAFAHRGAGASMWYDLTILPFVMWLLRYALLVDQGAGGAPEELVLTDGFLRAMSFAWALVFAGAVYVGG